MRGTPGGKRQHAVLDLAVLTDQHHQRPAPASSRTEIRYASAARLDFAVSYHRRRARVQAGQPGQRFAEGCLEPIAPCPTEGKAGSGSTVVSGSVRFAKLHQGIGRKKRKPSFGRQARPAEVLRRVDQAKLVRDPTSHFATEAGRQAGHRDSWA